MQRHHQLEKLYRSTRSGRVIIMSSYSSSKNVVNYLGTIVLDIEGILWFLIKWYMHHWVTGCCVLLLPNVGKDWLNTRGVWWKNSIFNENPSYRIPWALPYCLRCHVFYGNCGSYSISEVLIKKTGTNSLKIRSLSLRKIDQLHNSPVNILDCHPYADIYAFWNMHTNWRSYEDFKAQFQGLILYLHLTSSFYLSLPTGHMSTFEWHFLSHVFNTVLLCWIYDHCV